MSPDAWRVDPLQSYRIGLEYVDLTVEQHEHPWASSVPSLQMWCETVFVSICHSTNWDRLHNHTASLFQANHEILRPEALAKLEFSDMIALFDAGLERKERMLERHRLLVTLGEAALDVDLMGKFKSWSRNGVTLKGPGGLYATLDAIPAFGEDPLRKKARVLVHQFAGFGLMPIEDPQNMAPAIDYHLIRLYMRTGRIYPRQKSTYAAFSVDRSPRDKAMTEMRRAVEESMQHTAEGAEKRIDQLNHIEWQIARSFCVRSSPRCGEPALPEKPVDPNLQDLSDRRAGCPLRASCMGRIVPIVMSLKDPLSTRSFY